MWSFVVQRVYNVNECGSEFAVSLGPACTVAVLTGCCGGDGDGGGLD